MSRRQSRRLGGQAPEVASIPHPVRADRRWPYEHLPEHLTPEFNRLNQEVFGGRVTGCLVRWGTRNMRAHAGTTSLRDSSGRLKRTITLSKEILGKLPVEEFRGTLLHEMAHVAVHLDGHTEDSLEHGPIFQAEIARINRVTGLSVALDHPAAEAIVAGHRKYGFRCKACGYQLYLMTNRMPYGRRYGGHGCPRKGPASFEAL